MKKLFASKPVLVAGVGAAVKCPLCKGCGTLPAPHFKQKKMKEKREIAQQMRLNDYSIREIMKAMNYKSPRSVVKLLKP